MAGSLTPDWPRRAWPSAPVALAWSDTVGQGRDHRRRGVSRPPAGAAARDPDRRGAEPGSRRVGSPASRCSSLAARTAAPARGRRAEPLTLFDAFFRWGRSCSGAATSSCRYPHGPWSPLGNREQPWHCPHFTLKPISRSRAPGRAARCSRTNNSAGRRFALPFIYLTCEELPLLGALRRVPVPPGAEQQSTRRRASCCWPRCARRSEQRVVVP